MCHQHQRGGHWAARRGFWTAPVNIEKKDEGYHLSLIAPGREKDQFAIEVKDQALTIRYEAQTEGGENEWVRREFRLGSFERSFDLRANIDTSKIEARYENGILHVILPVIPGSETPAQPVYVA